MLPPMITHEDFKKVEIRAGKILSAEKIPDTDKLLKLSVDFGETKEAISEQAVIGADQIAIGEVQSVGVKMTEPKLRAK